MILSSSLSVLFDAHQLFIHKKSRRAHTSAGAFKPRVDDRPKEGGGEDGGTAPRPEGPPDTGAFARVDGGGASGWWF